MDRSPATSTFTQLTFNEILDFQRLDSLDEIAQQAVLSLLGMPTPMPTSAHFAQGSADSIQASDGAAYRTT
jgi:hypothetical protein